MADASNDSEAAAIGSVVIESAIRIGLIVLLVWLSLRIAGPFINLLIWAVVIAVACLPFYRWLARSLGGRQGWAATLFALLGIAVIVLPAVAVGTGLVDQLQTFGTKLEAGQLEVPAPPEGVAEWPIVGERVYDFWSLASENIRLAAEHAKPQLEAFSKWLLRTAASAGMGLLQLIISIVIAAVLLVHASAGGQLARDLFARVAPTVGSDFATLSEQVIRSVAVGIIGVAIIQGVLAGLGIFIAGIPLAALWTFLVLFLGIVQISPLLVGVPLIIYMYSTADTLAATLFLIWIVPVCMSDNV
ncbi:MAG: AI-2E family transporter, partial [Gammaproteobacteria bacterium]